jgi:hypothetical protein
MKNSTGWPLEADVFDRPGEPDAAGSVEVSYLDFAVSAGQGSQPDEHVGLRFRPIKCAATSR